MEHELIGKRAIITSGNHNGNTGVIRQFLPAGAYLKRDMFVVIYGVFPYRGLFASDEFTILDIDPKETAELQASAKS